MKDILTREDWIWRYYLRYSERTPGLTGAQLRDLKSEQAWNQLMSQYLDDPEQAADDEIDNGHARE